MITKFITFLTLITSITLSAQKNATSAKSPRVLARQITKNETSDSMKVVRVYEWITSHIAYDYDALKSGKSLPFATGADVLKSKKAICQGYSFLMAEMLKELEIPCIMVEGYSNVMLSDTLHYIAEADHQWVAVKLNNDWLACDPTWDAGYIGRIPKKDNWKKKHEGVLKKRKGKLDRIRNSKRSKRLTKRWDKRDQRHLDKVEKKGAQFTNKIGFVSQPSKHYFLQPADTFLYSHLPTQEGLQLRTKSIDMVSYTNIDRNMDSLLQHSTTSIDYKNYAETFYALPLQEQWLKIAQDGLKYNPVLYSGMAVHYNNYIGVHLSDKMRKEMGILEKGELKATLPELRQLNDSLKVYTKTAIKISKQANATLKKIVAAESKKFALTDKVSESEIKKLQKSSEASIQLVKKRKETDDKALKTIQEKRLKLGVNSSGKVEYQAEWIPDSFQAWMDSVQHQIKQIDSLRTSWDHIAHSDSIYQLRNDLLISALNNEHFNVEFLKASTPFYNDSIAYYDTIVAQQVNALNVYHKTIIPSLYYRTDVLKQAKELDRLIKTGTARLKNYSKAHVDLPLLKIQNYLLTTQSEMLMQIEKDLLQAKHDKSTLLRIEQTFKPYYKLLSKLMEEEIKFKKKNTAHNFDVLAKNQKRNQALFEAILSNSAKYEAYFKKVLGAK